MFKLEFLNLTEPKDCEKPWGLQFRSATNVASVGAFLPCSFCTRREGNKGVENDKK